MNARLVGRVLFPVHEWLKRKPTFRLLSELEATQWLPPDSLAQYRLRRLRRLLEFAYANVPYYRALMDQQAVTPRQVQSFADLSRLPVLTREILQTRFDDLRARAALPHVHRRSSGGSTGTPVAVLVDMGRMGMGEAARLRAHRWFGVMPGAPEVVLWGTPARLGPVERIRRVRDRCLNTRVLSAFDMGEEALRGHAATLRRVRPASLYGYASACHLIAAHFQCARLSPPGGLRAVFTTAEPLFDFQRKTIEAAFGCPVAVEYGCRDGGLVALECPHGGLHIVAESVHVEILEPDAAGQGEIVLTNFDSLAFPIIRYRTGDIGSLDPTPCPCGRALPKLRSVEGRRTDFLVTPSGRILHALSAIYILRDAPNVGEFRVLQEALDRILVEVVPSGPFGSPERALLVRQFATVFGSDVRVDVQCREEIARTAAGKFRYVESRIAPPLLEELMRAGRQGVTTHAP
jgi:phenylacetate-coenzyme A ligase PaaK-like adenylate-forming protein